MTDYYARLRQSTATPLSLLALLLCSQTVFAEVDADFSDDPDGFKSRYCDVSEGALEGCEVETLFTPQPASNCDSSVRYSAKSALSGLTYALPSVSTRNINYLESAYGTSYAQFSGNDKLLFNPAIIFPDEAFFLGKKLADDQKGGRQLVDSDEMSVNEKGTVSSEVYLYDDGTHGDAVAEDGYYSRACVILTDGASLFEGENLDLSIHEVDGLKVLNPNLRGTEEIYHVSENVLATSGGFFVEIGYDFTHANNNSLPLTNNPWDYCVACKRVLTLLGETANIMTLLPRDWSSKAWMLRLNDHARGAGFYYSESYPSYNFPAVNYDSRPLSDGENHLQLRAIINVAGPDFGGFEHEFEHALFGQSGSEFPTREFAINSQDGMHLDSDVTAHNTLTAAFKIRLPGEEQGYKEVWLYNDLYPDGTASQIEKVGDNFKLVPFNSARKTSDLFLYMAGLKDKTEVTETYYKLANPALVGCTDEDGRYRCTDDSVVTAEQVFAFGIDDWIEMYGEWSYAYGDIPETYKLAAINFSDRTHSEAEIIYSSTFSRHAAGQDSVLPQIAEIREVPTLKDLHSGLLKININAVELLGASVDYAAMTKAAPSDFIKSIYVQDIEAYKELYFSALRLTTTNPDGSICYGCTAGEDELNAALPIVTSAIKLVDELPHAYYERAAYLTTLGRYEEALADINSAYLRIRDQFPDMENYSGLDSYLSILALRKLLNGLLGNQDLVDSDTRLVAEYSMSSAWYVIDLYMESVTDDVDNICSIKPVNGFYDKEVYDDPTSTCLFENITADSESETQYVVDSAMWKLTKSFYQIGLEFEELSRIEMPKTDQLSALKQAVAMFLQGTKFDADGSSWFYRFLTRNLSRGYSDLADQIRFPNLTDAEAEFAVSQSKYWENIEAEVISKCMDKFSGTFYERYCGN